MYNTKTTSQSKHTFNIFRYEFSKALRINVKKINKYKKLYVLVNNNASIRQTSR